MKCNFLPSLTSLADLSDRDLLVAVQRSVSQERDATAVLIAHLAEIDSRKLYLGEGFDSLFTFCTRALHLSEDAAYCRIVAARAARTFPAILRMLADGSIHLTAVRLLAPHLTAENHREILASACHQGRRDVEKIVAALSPRPPVPDSVRKLPVTTSTAPPAATPQSAPTLQPVAMSVPSGPSAPPPPRPAVVCPLSPATYKIQFTASEATHDKLRLAQDMLRHQIPNGEIAEVIDGALTVLLERLARQKFAATPNPRPGKATAPGSRHISAEVRRAVWLRDLGRCAFVGRKGRCDARGFLEFHHVVPYALGGQATVESIELRCRQHNAHEAELVFGPLEIREEPSPYRPATASNLARAKYAPRAP